MNAMESKTLAGFLVWMLFFIQDAECSWGDRSYGFWHCLYNNEHLCEKNGYPAVLPFHLTLFGWSCIDELKYQCMHNATQENLNKGKPVLQYYGKWPFVRLLGIQEPASTLFSLGNMMAHIFGWLKFSRVASHNYKFYFISKMLFMISINAWIWSTIFHTRDLPFTEKMDYFCATFAVLSSTIVAFVRIFGDPLHPACFAFGLMVLVIYCFHIYIMSFIKFDYVYNMKFNVGTGLANGFTWLVWCFLKRKERPYVWKCAFVLVATTVFLSLELLDFPPIWLTFDAHSLWHLSTIPLSYFWYSFLIDDDRFEAKKTVKESKIL